MQISMMITEIGLEIDRTDLDERIKLWIQQAIDFVYSTLPWRSVQKSANLVTVASTRTVSFPSDYGETRMLAYDASDNSGKRVNPLPPKTFFAKYPGTERTGPPIDFTIFENKIHLSPTPDKIYNLDLYYRIASPNIYEHTVIVKDADGAAGTGVQVYVNEDAIGTGEGSLLFVSPTNNDAIMRIQTLDGHTHEFTINDDNDAATNGVAIYLDENSTDVRDRFLFVSPTNQNTVVRSETQRKHNHFLNFRDKDNAASDGVIVYCDEDSTEETERLLFVSPTDIDGSVTIVLDKEKEMSPFIETYHPVIFMYALAFGWKFLGRYDEMVKLLEVGRLLLTSASVSDIRGSGMEEVPQSVTPRSVAPNNPEKDRVNDQQGRL